MNLAGLHSKTTHAPSIESLAIARALDAVRGTPRCVPVVLGRKVIAEVMGVPWWACRADNGLFPDDAFWRPVIGKYAGFDTYDVMIREATQNGRKFFNVWSKGATTAPVAANWYDLWPVGGNPQPGLYTGSAYTARQFDDMTTGAMYHAGNVSTYTKHISRVYGRASAGTPTLFLYDRVLTYEACSFNAATLQAMTNTLTAQRYNGASLPGLLPVVTAQTVLGASATTFTTLTYTNQAGTGSRAVPLAASNQSIIVSAAAPTSTLGARVVAPAASAATIALGFSMPLQTGDGGVRSIESFTTSVANTGTLCFVLMHPLALIPLPVAGVGTQLDQVMQLIGLERVYDGACLSFLAYFAAATAATFDGNQDVIWGPPP